VENILQQNIPDLVLVHGDTNSTLGAALAASKLNVNLGHIEAGLRSFNENMPEEINRKIVDQISNLNFAPTKVACDNLLDEGIEKSKIFVTGNTIKDAIDWIKFNNIWDGEYVGKIGIRHKNYALATIHRAKTTGDIHLFGQIMAGLTEFANKSNLEFVYPIHPRSKQLLKEYNLNVPNQINLIDPLAYSDFLYLVENAKIIFTDSGGVQEEACILGTPCVTLRNDTERPETLKLGCNTLAGYNPRSIVHQGLEQLKTSSVVESAYGQGDSAERIFESILKNCSS
jgi:UDP-N-acetylglucosamine 2-epimerase (non-hydrolysing)